MFLAALSCEVEGLDPVGKYSLVRFIQCFGIAEPVDLGVKDLAKQFGLTDRQVSKALAALVASGVMTFSSTPDGRGRPKRYYRLQDSFVSKLNEVSSPPAALHEGAIGCLLKHERTASQSQKAPSVAKGHLADLRAKRQSGRLSVVNRLLLSVLLCRADRFGMVSDLGSATLCKLTGLSKEHLKHRSGRLIDQGWIRTYVPGATSRVLASKMKSIYYLNLNHPELPGGGGVTSALVCVPEFSFPDLIQHAYKIFQHVHHLKRNPESFQWSQYKQVVRFFEGQRLSLFLLLQVMLEKCAAHLLSKYWSKLVHLPLNKRIDAQELRELISKDFRPPALPSGTDDEQYAVVLDELYHGAYDLAVMIKEQLKLASDVPFETMDFVIIPRPLESGYSPLALLALPRSSSGWRSCLVIKQPTEGGVHRQRFSREADIPLEDRYLYGLLTRPGSEGAAG